MEDKHIFIAFMEVKPGNEDFCKKELLKVKELSLQEPECLSYHIHQDTEHMNRFVLYAIWESKEAQIKQYEKPYIIEFGDLFEDLVVKPCDVVMAKELI